MSRASSGRPSESKEADVQKWIPVALQDLDWVAIAEASAVVAGVFVFIVCAQVVANILTRKTTVAKLVHSVERMVYATEAMRAARKEELERASVVEAERRAKRDAENPFGKAWNLTRQGVLLMTDPNEAYALAKEAGVNIGEVKEPPVIRPDQDVHCYHQSYSADKLELPPDYFPSEAIRLGR